MVSHPAGAGPAADVSGCRHRRPDAARPRWPPNIGCRDSQSLNIAAFAEGQWSAESTRMATAFGGFVGCDADEIVFTRGTGEALATVANGLDLNAGDEILTTNREHPAVLSPWLLLAQTPRHRRQTDRPAGADERPGTSPRPVRRRRHRTHQSHRVLSRAVCGRHVDAGAGAVSVRPPAQLDQRRRRRAGAWACWISSCATWAAISTARRFTSGSAAATAPACCTYRRDMLDRIWPSLPARHRCVAAGHHADAIERSYRRAGGAA